VRIFCILTCIELFYFRDAGALLSLMWKMELWVSRKLGPYLRTQQLVDRLDDGDGEADTNTEFASEKDSNLTPSKVSVGTGSSELHVVH